MINLTIDWKPVEVEFMGETVTAEVRPLDSEQMLLIVPFLSNADPKDLNESSKSVLTLQQAAAPILSSIIRNIKGVQVNGADVDFEMLGKEAALCGLAIQLVSQAVIVTNLDKDSEKNLQSPPAGRSPGRIADR